MLGANFAWLFAAAVQDVGVSMVKGGMHHVSRALAAELAAHGGEIRISSSVKGVDVEKGRATSVRLEDGETIALDPRHLALYLLGEALVGEGIAGKIRRYNWGQSFFGIYLALDSPVPYRAGSDADQAGYVHIGRPFARRSCRDHRARPCRAPAEASDDRGHP